MLKIENWEVVGWEHAIRGARNPMNSWEKSDSNMCGYTLQNAEIAPGVTSLEWRQCKPYIDLGESDHDLLMRLRNAGTDHRKFMRMITVYLDITAPLYWWKEFDTYKVGTVANSCSTMHKIADKEFEEGDFSTEHLFDAESKYVEFPIIYGEEHSPIWSLNMTIKMLNFYRKKYLETKTKPMKEEAKRAQLIKAYWWQMIQLLPSSYNQKRTVMLNYEVLANIYKSRRNHKLDEWHVLCDWIEKLPYSELITGNSLEDIPICKEIMNEAKKKAKEEKNESNQFPLISDHNSYFLDDYLVEDGQFVKTTENEEMARIRKEESTKLEENYSGFLECTNCHKVFGNIPLVESAEFAFCPYCGRKFIKEE